MDIVRDESVKKKRRQKQMMMYGLAVVVVLGITLGVSRLRPADPPVEFSTLWPDTVKRGAFARQVHGLGTLVPIPEDIRLIPAETDARVEKILVLPGSAPVKPDTILMELSNPQVVQAALSADLDLKSAMADYQNTRTRVNGDLLTQKALAATVEADYENAKRDANNNKELFKIGVVSESVLKASLAKEHELETRFKIEQERIAENTNAVTTQLAVQQAKIDQMRTLAEVKHKQMDALKVRAGIAGVLQDLLGLQVGQRVTQGTILAKVVQPSHLQAELKIPETQVNNVRIGHEAEIDTHNGIVKGKVIRIDPAVQNGTVTVEVKLDGPPPGDARPDLSVDGTITMERLTDVLYSGRPAFGQENSKVSMFKIDADGKTATKVVVELGRASVCCMEIVRGLKEGDQVILSDMSRWDNVNRVKLER
ncbi:MAG TPA: HlyD family efflux transporter periplasmic adaptor subunit [Alphaproteobacteria bacterium]|nr:HlyD family efflux transporter periplasmic adaptor subunit [Alphaproteobacteria bacterium]